MMNANSNSPSAARRRRSASAPTLLEQALALGDVKDVWLAESSYLTLSGSDVTAWAGAANGNSWITDGADPLWQPTSWSDGGGQVQFATGEKLICGTLEPGETSNDWTLLALLDQIDTTTNSMFLLQLGTNAAFGMTTNSTTRQSYFDGAYRGSSTNIVSGEQVRTWVLDSGGGTVAFYKDGVSHGTDTYAGTAALDSVNQLGSYPTLPTNLSEVKAILLYREALSSANRAAAEAALAAYGGL